MNVKHALSAILICGLGASSLTAQSTRGRAHAKAQMWSALALTESQQTRVNTIHARYVPAMKLAKKQPTDSAAKIFAREMAEVRALLTISQQQTFDTYMAGNPKPRRGSVAKVAPLRIAVPR
ncbi:MAG TPA: hypothetical protein VIG47_02625 [Gemmatimonadaceae bacterium]